VDEPDAIEERQKARASRRSASDKVAGLMDATKFTAEQDAAMDQLGPYL
jgi:hypothetical protein